MAWQLPGYWGISVGGWRGLSGPAWEVEAIGSLRHDHIPPNLSAGAWDPGRAWGGGQGRGALKGGSGSIPKAMCVWGDWLGGPQEGPLLGQCPSTGAKVNALTLPRGPLGCRRAREVEGGLAFGSPSSL